MKARIRVLEPQDGAGVAALIARVGFDTGADREAPPGGEMRPANPALASGDSDLPRGWVIEAEQKIVGHLGNLAMRYRFQGRDVLAAAASGYIVDPEYRGMSIRLIAKFANQQHADLLLNTSADQTTGEALKAFRFQPVPSPDYDRALYWVCDAFGFSGVAAARLGLTGPLALLARPALTLAIAARRLQGGRYTGDAGLSVENTQTIAESRGELDRFWQALQRDNPRLLAERSGAALAWHFGGGRSVRLLRCLRAGELVGYAVLADIPAPALGLRRLRIVDLVVLGEAAEIVDALLFAARAAAAAEKFHILELIGFPSEIRRRALATNPLSRNLPVWPFLYKAKNSKLAEALGAPENWYASPYDGDAAIL